MRMLVLALLASFVPISHASEAIIERFNYVMADEQRREQASLAGQERAVFCSYCHGEAGNSKRKHIPNLAGQNPLYLFHSFEKFASGERVDFVMSKLAKNLSTEERVNIAVFFSQQKVSPPEGTPDVALRKAGEKIFQTTCTGCHGAHAEGMETMPRLAGQPDEYIRKALTRFRENDPSRTGSVMIGVASHLSAADVEALATYLSHLRLTPAEEMANINRLRKTTAAAQ
ncbi:c-type cytochrome [Pseudomonas stutzeri]|uniref:Cytochrome biogenesis protein ResB n=1 Tax=Stutzerimonas stutzeri TaxID=316 RepID=A0A2N8S4W9_STUST|nr:c-type cytochrome [Stutzerimonas stutzeri]MCQ4296857.1 c-type cytochrome [Stutzerimonas stutzeri]PNF81673.1 cytochrome biogenesis protein ResB [Stutzerimonas stutzeri]